MIRGPIEDPTSESVPYCVNSSRRGKQTQRGSHKLQDALGIGVRREGQVCHLALHIYCAARVHLERSSVATNQLHTVTPAPQRYSQAE